MFSAPRSAFNEILPAMPSWNALVVFALISISAMKFSRSPPSSRVSMSSLSKLIIRLRPKPMVCVPGFSTGGYLSGSTIERIVLTYDEMSTNSFLSRGDRTLSYSASAILRSRPRPSFNEIFVPATVLKLMPSDSLLSISASLNLMEIPLVLSSMLNMSRRSSSPVIRLAMSAIRVELTRTSIPSQLSYQKVSPSS